MTTTSTATEGFAYCRCGHRHWGRNGAAGLVLLRRRHGRPQILMQLRSPWVQLGDTWSVPGGAVDEGEDVFDAAIREATEEGINANLVLVGAVTGVDHVDWAYEYVIAWAEGPVTVNVDTEASDTRWIDVDMVSALDLHPGFAESWRGLRATLDQHVL